MKKTLICIIIVLLLTACSKASEQGKTVASNSSEPNISAPYELMVAPEDRNQAFAWENFVETPEAYYYGWEHLIYFCPRGDATFRPLCGKPNCPHNDEKCNAWFEGTDLGYYDGAFFTTSSSRTNLSVIRIELDGSDHREVAQVDISKICQAYACTFHHGKLLIQSQASYFTDSEEDETVDQLIVLDLSVFSETEPAVDFLCTAHLPLMMNFYKDKMYGFGTGNHEHMNDSNIMMLELDAVSGEARELVPGGRITGLYATDDTFYYLETDHSERSDELMEGIRARLPGA